MNNKNGYVFNVEEQTDNCIKWIKHWFNNCSGNAKGVIIGISGGKDSTVAAKLLCEAIGSEKVLGVMMPNGQQKDIHDSKKVCEMLKIRYTTVNIQESYQAITNSIECSEFEYSNSKSINLSSHTLTNIAPRLRMTTVYTIGQELSYRIVGTGNLSESLVGYCTKYGDTACDFAILSTFTKREVVKIGEYLGLPRDLIQKEPSDGLSGVSDEENLGFSYEVLDKFIRVGVCEDKKIKEIIKNRWKINNHKRNIQVPHYNSEISICIN
ncbi:NAD(+) synthase [Oceanirhabdus seepicola]|uniref:NH(3)-dependent NAD(+) synthetase n=1 Tax=Oceanirhabdus seepicola TaxID=2828781 RepID=A0A9J6NYX7_9CLOT|nr:NAD(+) synthase [Oceanirhabdus seepicola]MCM1988352.1 NAD(+) synthase [Oceanirhabdus seepicola]